MIDLLLVDLSQTNEPRERHKQRAFAGRGSIS